MMVVFIFFAGPIRTYSSGSRVNNSYSHSRRGNSHFDTEDIKLFRRSGSNETGPISPSDALLPGIQMVTGSILRSGKTFVGGNLS